MSRFLLKLADRAPLVWTLGCGALPFKNWFDGVPSAMSGQCDLEDRQLAMGLETTKAFGGLQHGGSRPAQGHCGIAPVLYVAADAPVTNGFRCEWGAETYAAFRSVVSTAKANRASVLDTIRFVLAAKLPAGPIAGAGVSNYERWLSGDDYTFTKII